MTPVCLQLYSFRQPLKAAASLGERLLAATLTDRLNRPRRDAPHLVEVRVPGDIVAPLLGEDEGFPLVAGLVHLTVHRLASDQTVCHVVASLNRAAAKRRQLNKWMRRSSRPGAPLCSAPVVGAALRRALKSLSTRVSRIYDQTLDFCMSAHSVCLFHKLQNHNWDFPNSVHFPCSLV